MNDPDSLVARRDLRKLRIQDALGLDPSEERESALRDHLLLTLASEYFSDSESERKVSPESIDAAVSVALSRIDETSRDYLLALSLAAQVLAVDNQFARLSLLSGRFRDLSEQLEERPFLTVALRAFSEVIRGGYRDALAELNLALGLQADRSPSHRVERTKPNVADVLLANALRYWLQEQSLERFEQTRQFALNFSDGLLLTLVELFSSYADAAVRSSTLNVLEAAGSPFQYDQLRNYIQRRGITTLFPAQRAAVEAGALAQGSRLIAMPTSSGKTFLAELRILSELNHNPNGRIIYLTPYKVLARQVEDELRNGLRQAGFSVRDLGGAFDISIQDELLSEPLPSVAIMTPERCDALLRLSGSSHRGNEIATDLFSSTILIVFDEIHLLGRPSRGPRLELFLVRLRYQLPDVPILGLAALAEGVGHLADWLGIESPIVEQSRPTGSLELLWKPNSSLMQRFSNENYKVATLPLEKTAVASAAVLATRIREERYPILIIETTRQLAEDVVERIKRLSPRAGDRWRDSLPINKRQALDATAEIARATFGEANNLADLIRQGLAFHHAGVPAHLLREIERLVKMGAIRALGATTTVAEGTHLPFQVVIIPHLNFPGSSGKLEKDLYQNIVGRAGRVNVGMEGIVITIGSDSDSLRGHVDDVLWNPDKKVDVRGRLVSALARPSDEDQYRTYREVEAQVLAWLGDSNTYIEDQVSQLTQRTFSWHVASSQLKEELELRLESLFHGLEEDGFAIAASPYQLTTLGHRARLAGLGIESCLRMAGAIERLDSDAIVAFFNARDQLDIEACDAISRIVFEAEEVIERSLWFRAITSKLNRRDRVSAIQQLMSSGKELPYEDEIFRSDLNLLSGWIQGQDFVTLGRLAPVFTGGRGIFSSNDTNQRASDAAEQLGKLSYQAAWAWGAFTAMLGEDGDLINPWIRSAIELGVPSETTVELIRVRLISRSSAVKLQTILSPDWETAQNELADLTWSDLIATGIPSSDLRQLRPDHETA